MPLGAVLESVERVMRTGKPACGAVTVLAWLLALHGLSQRT
jgi:hypothetical protein